MKAFTTLQVTREELLNRLNKDLNVLAIEFEEDPRTYKTPLARGYDWATYEDWCSAGIDIKFNGKRNPFRNDEITPFTMIDFTTVMSGYLYKFTMIEENKWCLSFDGKYNALNAQSHLPEIFALDNKIVIESSYREGLLTRYEYEEAKSFFMERFEEGISFEDIYEEYNGCTNTTPTEEEILLDQYGF